MPCCYAQQDTRPTKYILTRFSEINVGLNQITTSTRLRFQVGHPNKKLKLFKNSAQTNH